ncbi:hypothetical protein RCC89_16245 [Cytophagaceae bacterium ABcell3]|nr:hypothetical protein RCC89_16245 [Cytophagaceae bacterium ABcell3]
MVVINPEWITAVSSLMGAFVALGAVLVAYFQLKGLRRSINNESLMVIISLENEVSVRKVRMSKVLFELKKSHVMSKDRELLKAELNTTKEDYLNALDRLCYVILEGFLSEKDWKKVYHTYLNHVTESLQDFFVSGAYPNIVELKKKWDEQ